MFDVWQLRQLITDFPGLPCSCVWGWIYDLGVYILTESFGYVFGD